MLTVNFMGLGADGTPTVPDTATSLVAAIGPTDDEVKTVRRMYLKTSALAIGTATLVTAATFKLAKTERAWAPALFHGGLAAIVTLVGYRSLSNFLDEAQAQAKATRGGATTAVIAVPTAKSGY